MIEIATGKKVRENTKEKHKIDAKYGWYKYDSRFARPVYDGEQIVRYNIFNASLIIRHAENNKLYLYDIIDIKKKKRATLDLTRH